jgi:hypothetical protein
MLPVAWIGPSITPQRHRRHGKSPRQEPAQTRSLSAFMGMARTTFLAGLAWIVIAAPVNGFLPGRALVAGLRTTLSFRRPGRTNWPGPFLPSSLAIRSFSAVKAPAIWFLDRLSVVENQ